jgi:hypothetical protein
VVTPIPGISILGTGGELNMKTEGKILKGYRLAETDKNPEPSMDGPRDKQKMYGHGTYTPHRIVWPPAIEKKKNDPKE